MKKSLSKRSSLALAICVVAAFATVSASPASADVDGTRVCQVLLATTPVVTVDEDGDGNPEFTSPRVHDVILCAGTPGVGIATYLPTIERCGTTRLPECVAVRIAVLPVHPSVDPDLTLCFGIDGTTRCVDADMLMFEISGPRWICIGIDLNGGHPCDGSVFSLE
ncbi:MAG: hypothetical protein M3273_00300 [Actinomycetota bacterium]|nr:hypothetical protein [Actinomycetota bacterium]